MLFRLRSSVVYSRLSNSRNSQSRNPAIKSAPHIRHSSLGIRHFRLRFGTHGGEAHRASRSRGPSHLGSRCVSQLGKQRPALRRHQEVVLEPTPLRWELWEATSRMTGCRRAGGSGAQARGEADPQRDRPGHHPRGGSLRRGVHGPVSLPARAVVEQRDKRGNVHQYRLTLCPLCVLWPFRPFRNSQSEILHDWQPPACLEPSYSRTALVVL